MYAYKEFNGVRHVWDVYTDSWVTEEYWEWVNARGLYDNPPVRTYDPES